MDLAFPYGFDASGRTASPDLSSHIKDLIELVLLTWPGERVNRPTFGSGTGQLVFAPNSDTLAAAQQQLVQASLQQWLADLIQVQSVQISNTDSTLQVTVQYVVRQTQEQQTAQIITGGAGP